MRHVGWCDVYHVSNASVGDNPGNFPRNPSAAKGCLHVRLARVRLDVPYCYEVGKVFAQSGFSSGGQITSKGKMRASSEKMATPGLACWADTRTIRVSMAANAIAISSKGA